MSDFADFALSCWPAVVEVIAVLFTGWLLLQLARLALHLAARPRLRDLMDDGDGQGGIPPIARRLSAADAQTQAMSMRGLPDSWTPRPDGVVPLDQIVVNAEFERMAARMHWDSARDMLDGDDAG